MRRAVRWLVAGRHSVYAEQDKANHATSAGFEWRQFVSQQHSVATPRPGRRVRPVWKVCWPTGEWAEKQAR